MPNPIVERARERVLHQVCRRPFVARGLAAMPASDVTDRSSSPMRCAKVRQRDRGRVLYNAKKGGCSEDYGFCSQALSLRLRRRRRTVELGQGLRQRSARRARTWCKSEFCVVVVVAVDKLLERVCDDQTDRNRTAADGHRLTQILRTMTYPAGRSRRRQDQPQPRDLRHTSPRSAPPSYDDAGNLSGSRHGLELCWRDRQDGRDGGGPARLPGRHTGSWSEVPWLPLCVGARRSLAGPSRSKSCASWRWPAGAFQALVRSRRPRSDAQGSRPGHALRRGALMLRNFADEQRRRYR